MTRKGNVKGGLFFRLLALVWMLVSWHASTSLASYAPAKNTRAFRTCMQRCKQSRNQHCRHYAIPPRWQTYCREYTVWEKQCREYTSWRRSCRDVRRIELRCRRFPVTSRRCFRLGWHTKFCQEQRKLQRRCRRVTKI